LNSFQIRGYILSGSLGKIDKFAVVEDEKRMAELLCKGLEEEGHTVVCAADGIAGLEMSRSYEFDMIILDIMMPRLDGYELAKKLRAEKVPTPILMLTAKDSLQDIVGGLDLGTDDYLTKPFSFNGNRDDCGWLTANRK
jgi:two-component system OmpR family response regulator